MAEIIPTILARTYEDLKNKISLVRGLVPVVQIDICDGVFVPSMTWPFSAKATKGAAPAAAKALAGEQEENLDRHFVRIMNEEEGLPFWEDVDFEIDLMVHDAVSNFDIYTKLGPRRIIFHLEAVGDLREFCDFLEGIDMYVREAIEIGVAVSPGADLKEVYPVVPLVDFVQVMGIDREGVQGERFDDACVDLIRNLKEKFPDLIISVDGSVNFETAPLLVAAGADRLVIGSAIWRSDDIIDTIERFKSI